VAVDVSATLTWRVDVAAAAYLTLTRLYSRLKKNEEESSEKKKERKEETETKMEY